MLHVFVAQFCTLLSDVAFLLILIGKIWKLSIPLSSLVQADLAHSRPPASASTLSNAINTKGSRQRY